MLSGRTFAAKRLPLTIAFTVLLVASFGAGCKGFFVKNTLNSIAIQPSSVNLEVNATQAFSAWGTYQDGSRSQITSGVVWLSNSPSVTITTGGTATAQNVTTSSVTITGSAQGLSGTATVNVIGNVTSIAVSPSTASMTINGSSQAFTFAASPGPPNYITADNGGTLTVLPADGFFTCAVGVDGSNNPAEVCSVTTGAASTYTLQMSYPSPSGGTVTSPTATVTVH